MSKLKNDQSSDVRPLRQRYGFFVHLAFFVLFAIFSSADFPIRVTGLMIHFALPYIWNGVFGTRLLEAVIPQERTRRHNYTDIHVGFFAAALSMLWGNVIVDLGAIVWNGSLIMLTVLWTILVSLNLFTVRVMDQRDAAEAHAAQIEEELAITHETYRDSLRDVDAQERLQQYDDSDPALMNHR